MPKAWKGQSWDSDPGVLALESVFLATACDAGVIDLFYRWKGPGWEGKPLAQHLKVIE